MTQPATEPDPETDLQTLIAENVPGQSRKKRRSAFRDAVMSLWPGIGRSALPERIAGAIAANDNVSEVLVKLIQLAVFALWGLLFLATPQPDPTTVSRVPLVVGIYLVVNIALLIVALTKRTPSWLIYVSIFVDMALLTYLIFSFHIQYGQPASFSLKAVEAMNYFVLIALRTLRFEARYVLAAGFMAIAGWIALVVYVTTNEPGDPMVTRDYVTYLTSNSVLVGAEISKMISMGMVTIILAIAVRRAHAFLVSAYAERTVAEDMSRFMSAGVAEQIRDSEHAIVAGEGVRREAAIVNVDIRGFTGIVADLPPDDAMSLLSHYQGTIVPLVHKRGGSIDKFMGDGIMITFGVTSDDATYCANAVRLLDDIIAAGDTLSFQGKPLAVNMALDAGTVIYGAVGEGDRLEYTVIGEPVNRSAKLEKHNKALGTRAIATRPAFVRALEQGYRRAEKPKEVSSHTEDGSGPFDLVILA